MRTTLLFLFLALASAAGCVGDDAVPPQRTLSGTWVPRSASPTAYDCADNATPLELQDADEWVEVTIADGQGHSTVAGGRCSDAGFTALVFDGATDVQLTFVVSNVTYAYPATTLQIPGPVRADLDLGHVAIVPQTRTSP